MFKILYEIMSQFTAYKLCNKIQFNVRISLAPSK